MSQVDTAQLSVAFFGSTGLRVIFGILESWGLECEVVGSMKIQAWGLGFGDEPGINGNRGRHGC